MQAERLGALRVCMLAICGTLVACERSPVPAPPPPGWRTPPQKIAADASVSVPSRRTFPANTPAPQPTVAALEETSVDHPMNGALPTATTDALQRETLTRLIPFASEALVHVVTWRTARSAPLFPSWGREPWPFWDPFGGTKTPVPEQRHSEPASLGSGFLVNAEGWVVTNHHVVENADDIFVVLSSGERLRAECLGTDPPTDLAILRVEGGPRRLPHLPLGDSSALQAGDFVVALGNPYGLGRSVSFGIVSATGRSGLGIVDVEDFVQTDAAIHPGNSGGPLLNLSGEVIGVNAAILSPSGAFAGIGFAIPSEILRFVLHEIETEGRVVRGHLGVTVQALSPQLAAHLGSPTDQGVLVADVVAAGPASGAGIRRGDLILRVNEKEIARPAELRTEVATLGAQETVLLDLWRDRQALQLEVRLQASPDAPAPVPKPGRDTAKAPLAHWGLHFVDTPGSMQQELAGRELPAGALLRRLDENSPGAWAGLRVGDVLLKIDQQAVRSAREAEHVLDKSRNDVLLLLQRAGHTFFVLLERSP